jgi:hypothetical protein
VPFGASSFSGQDGNCKLGAVATHYHTKKQAERIFANSVKATNTMVTNEQKEQ